VAHERVFKGKTKYFIPKSEVDLVSDDIWKHGEGDLIRARDREESKKKKSSMKLAIFKVLFPYFLKTV
jgi:hypothetical protein